MPLYEYQCESCAHRFERILKFSDPPVETCPQCGGQVRKLLSSPAIQFKGTGWYITDYAKKGGEPKSDKAEKTEAGATDKADKTDKTDKAEKSEKAAATPSDSKSGSSAKSE